MESLNVPTNFRDKVQHFAEKWNKVADLFISEKDNGEKVAGIQIGNPESNMHEMIIHINVNQQKCSGFIMEGTNISQNMIAESRDLADSLMRSLEISLIFGGK